jgi:hypothetical protein
MTHGLPSCFAIIDTDIHRIRPYVSSHYLNALLNGIDESRSFLIQQFPNVFHVAFWNNEEMPRGTRNKQRTLSYNARSFKRLFAEFFTELAIRMTR